MFKNISIGQYYPVESFIHRLDSRVKLVFTLVYIAMLFVITDIIGYALAFLFISLVIGASKVPVRFMLRGLKAIFIIILFTAVLNAFFTPGVTVLVTFGPVTVTAEGLITAAKMCTRLVFLIVGSSVLTYTTTPIQLTDAIEYLLKPLKKIGVPAHEIAMMMSIALRMIPTLMEEMDKIMKAQMARGADFDTGGLIKKAKSLVPLLVPLFISSFRRAEELALAMEARCYRGDVGRTRMKEAHVTAEDYKAICVMALFCALCVVSAL